MMRATRRRLATATLWSLTLAPGCSSHRADAPLRTGPSSVVPAATEDRTTSLTVQTADTAVQGGGALPEAQFPKWISEMYGDTIEPDAVMRLVSPALQSLRPTQAIDDTELLRVLSHDDDDFVKGLLFATLLPTDAKAGAAGLDARRAYSAWFGFGFDPRAVSVFEEIATTVGLTDAAGSVAWQPLAPLAKARRISNEAIVAGTETAMLTQLAAAFRAVVDRTADAGQAYLLTLDAAITDLSGHEAEQLRLDGSFSKAMLEDLGYAIFDPLEGSSDLNLSPFHVNTDGPVSLACYFVWCTPGGDTELSPGLWVDATELCLPASDCVHFARGTA